MVVTAQRRICLLSNAHDEMTMIIMSKEVIQRLQSTVWRRATYDSKHNIVNQ